MKSIGLPWLIVILMPIAIPVIYETIKAIIDLIKEFTKK